MTLLDTKFASGAMFTAGASGATIGISGINEVTGRINFGGYDFPQTENRDYTYNIDGFKSQVVYSGGEHYYQADILYGSEGNPTKVVVSGPTIGSTFTYNFFYEGGSGTTAFGEMTAGSLVIT